MATVTLLTDFGLSDPFVGMMKGVILARAPHASIVDLSHDMPPFRPEAAGFWLARCTRWFAAGTVHVAVVDPGVGTDRRALAVHGPGWFALAPDNGLLAPLLERHPDAAVRALDIELLQPRLPQALSRTFHGRDLFAPVAADLATGALQWHALGPLVHDAVSGTPMPVRRGADGCVHGQVVLIDRYGNLITNLESQDLPDGTATVRAGALAVPLVRSYADVAAGEPLAVVNAHGLLEIAVNCGSAAQSLGALPGTPVSAGPDGSIAR